MLALPAAITAPSGRHRWQHGSFIGSPSRRAVVTRALPEPSAQAKRALAECLELLKHRNLDEMLQYLPEDAIHEAAGVKDSV